MSKTKVLGLCGSLRADSWNLKLLKNFLPALDPQHFETRLYGKLDMPLVNEDLETKPLPQPILDFRSALEESPVVAIACPEYNSSITPALKNAIDWATRPPGNLWQGKIVVLLAASPGALGGARGLIHVRAVLSNIRAWVIPDLVLCPHADQAFDGEGRLGNEATRKQISQAIAGLRSFAEKQLR
jgi:chromate reductase, NAD(P)H dehydrogenase (quinone)